MVALSKEKPARIQVTLKSQFASDYFMDYFRFQGIWVLRSQTSEG